MIPPPLPACAVSAAHTAQTTVAFYRTASHTYNRGCTFVSALLSRVRTWRTTSHTCVLGVWRNLGMQQRPQVAITRPQSPAHVRTTGGSR